MIDLKDLKQVLEKKIKEANDYDEIFTICDFGKELAYQGNLNENK